MSLLSAIGLGPRPANPTPASPPPAPPPAAKQPAGDAASSTESGEGKGSNAAQQGEVAYQPQPAPAPAPVYMVEPAAPLTPVSPADAGQMAVREIGAARFDEVRLRTATMQATSPSVASAVAQAEIAVPAPAPEPVTAARSIYARAMHLLLAGQPASTSARIVADL